VEADGEEQHGRQRHATQSGDAGPQAEERTDADCQLAECDDDAEWRGELQQVAEQHVQRADAVGAISWAWMLEGLCALRSSDW